MTINPLAILLEKNTLTGPNFVDWLRNLRIVLSMESLGRILDADIPAAPVRTRATQEECDAHAQWVKDDVRVRGYMLGSMSNELQRAHEKLTTSRAILAHLTELYGEHSRTARYEISKQLFGSRMREGEKVGDHVLKMISMIERLEALDFQMHASLQTDLILQSLPDSFSQFVMNFNCNEIACNLAGLMNKLVTAQSQMKTKAKESALVVSSSPWRTGQKKKKDKKQGFPRAGLRKGRARLQWFKRVRGGSWGSDDHSQKRT